MSIYAYDLLLESAEAADLMAEMAQIISCKKTIAHQKSNDSVLVGWEDTALLLRKRNLLVKNVNFEIFPSLLMKLRPLSDASYLFYYNDDELVFSETRGDLGLAQICHPEHFQDISALFPELFSPSIKLEVTRTDVVSLKDIWHERYFEIIKYSYLYEGNDTKVDLRDLDKLIVIKQGVCEIFTRKNKSLRSPFASIAKGDLLAITRAIASRQNGAVPAMLLFKASLKRQLEDPNLSENQRKHNLRKLKSLDIKINFLTNGAEYLVDLLKHSNDQETIHDIMYICNWASLGGFNDILKKAVISGRIDYFNNLSLGASVIKYFDKNGTTDDLDFINYLISKSPKRDITFLNIIKTKIVKQ